MIFPGGENGISPTQLLITFQQCFQKTVTYQLGLIREQTIR